MNADNLNLRELLLQIYSDKYVWKGYENGDTETKFQARKCEQTALVLLVVSKILSHEEEIKRGDEGLGITKEEARNLFYDHIRHLADEYEGDSATSNIRFDVIPNLYKLVANHLPSEKQKQVAVEVGAPVEVTEEPEVKDYKYIQVADVDWIPTPKGTVYVEDMRYKIGEHLSICITPKDEQLGKEHGVGDQKLSYDYFLVQEFFEQQ